MTSKFLQALQLFHLSLLFGDPKKPIGITATLKAVRQDWKEAKRGNVRTTPRGSTGKTHQDLVQLILAAESSTDASTITKLIRSKVKLTAKPSRVYRAKDNSWYSVKDVWEHGK